MGFADNPLQGSLSFVRTSWSTILFSWLPVLILSLIAWCRIFKKAGVPMGYVFIPIYGAYREYKLARAADLFLGSMGVTILAVAAQLIVKHPLILALVLICYLIISLVIQAVFCRKLAQAFGRSPGFAVGLFFLAPVFLMILGFGDARYLTDSEDEAIESGEVWICPYCETENSASEQTCSGCGERRARNKPE